MGKKNQIWKSLLSYGLLLVAICLLLYFYREAYGAFKECLRFFSSKGRINAFVSSFGPYSPLAFVLVQILQVLFAPIPGELTGFLGGYLYGTSLGLLYSTFGLTAGSVLAFFVSRKLGMPFVRRFAGQDMMRRFDCLMEHQGAFFSFVFFLIPGLPKDYFCYLLGLSPMHLLTFVVITSIGRIPGTLLLSMQGQAIRSEDYRAFFVVLGIALFAILLAFIYRKQVERWLKCKTLSPRLPG